MTDSPTPSRTPSISLGVGVYVVLSLLATLGAAQAGSQAVQVVAGCLACLVILAGPMAAVWHYTSTHRLTMLAGPGAGLGAIVGAVGAVVAGLLSQLLVRVGVLPTPAETMARQRDQMLSQGMDPAQVEQAMAFGQQMAAFSDNPLLGIALGGVVGALVGALGGALGAVLFKKGPVEPGEG